MVKTVYLDCANLTQRESAHAYLARTLDLPDYYGKNLDALYDCLTDMPPCTVVLAGAQALRQSGGYGAKLLSVLEDAALSNPTLELVYASDM